MAGTVKKMENTDKHNISYAAFHANRINEKRNHADISALMPIWIEDSKSPAMIKHALDVMKNAVTYLNPPQVPLVAFDQPLYSIAKQWYYSNHCGITIFVIMMGALHIEMSFLGALGHWQGGSGWTTLVTNANVTRPGVALLLLSGKNVAPTFYIFISNYSLCSM